MKGYVLIALWLASLVAVGLWQRHDGAVAERSLWQTKESQEVKAANARLVEITAKYRQAEAENAKAMAEKDAAYQEELSHEKTAHDRAIAAVRAGALKLRDPFAQCPLGGATAAVGASPRLGDGQAGTGLSDQAAEFLLGEASRANAVVEQLTACQAVIVADRELCGGAP